MDLVTRKLEISKVETVSTNDRSFDDAPEEPVAPVTRRKRTKQPTGAGAKTNGGPTDKQLRALVKEHLWTFFKYRFTVDVGADGPTADDLEIEGDFTGHEYAFLRGGRPVAQVSEKWFSLADTYGVDVSPGEDAVLVLAATVIVDLCVEKHRRS